MPQASFINLIIVNNCTNSQDFSSVLWHKLTSNCQWKQCQGEWEMEERQTVARGETGGGGGGTELK